MRNEETAEMLERLREAAKGYQDESEHCSDLLRDYEGLSAFLSQTEMTMITAIVEEESGDRSRYSIMIGSLRRQEMLEMVRGWQGVVARHIVSAVERWEANSE